MISNFDFTNATVKMSPKFGTSYIAKPPGIDSTGFSVTLNPNYTMANIPMIIGTAAYWSNSGTLIYSQLSFGSSTGTTNAIQAKVTCTTSVTTSPTYGSPLTLTISGLSITSGVFGSASDISTGAPLNYALQVYLEILN
jgi:hypothetical protein